MSYDFLVTEIRRILKSPVMNFSNKPMFYSRFSSVSSMTELESLYHDIKTTYEDIGSTLGSNIRTMI